MSESFKVPGRKRSIPEGKEGYKTRVTEEAYAALVESCNESTRSSRRWQAELFCMRLNILST